MGTRRTTAGLTQRELDFARNVVAGMTQQQAMIDAGYTPSTARGDTGTKTQRRQDFQDELARLRAGMARRLNITLDSLILDLAQDREAARLLDRPEGAARITMQMATLLGFTGDKQQVDITIINKPLPYPTKENQLSVDEWIERFSPKEITHQGGGHG